MVDPLTAGLAGIALVTKVTEHIKQGINAYNSVAELGGQIDALFKGEQECQKARNKAANRQDTFSTESVAKEVIDHKLAQEKLQEVAVAVDMRFGHGTWASIIAERQRRIREAKEAARQAAIERQRKHNQNMETLKAASVGVITAILLVASLVGAFVFAK